MSSTHFVLFDSAYLYAFFSVLANNFLTVFFVFLLGMLGPLFVENYFKKSKRAPWGNLVALLTHGSQVGAAVLIVTYLHGKIEEDIFAKRVGQQIDEKVPEALEKASILPEGARLHGLVRIDEQVDFSKLVQSDMQNADEVYFVTTFYSNAAYRLPLLIEPAARGKKIRFIVLAPGSPIALAQGREVDSGMNMRGSYFDGMQAFGHALKNIVCSPQSRRNISVVQYDDLLRGPLILGLREHKPLFAYSSQYLNVWTSLNYPNFYWRPAVGNPYIERIAAYVMQIWNESKSGNAHIRPVSYDEECNRSAKLLRSL